MRHGKNSRLHAALGRLGAGPQWAPPPGERETCPAFDDFEDYSFDDPEMARRDFTDVMIAGLDDEVSHEVFESLAIRGEDAEQLLVEEDASPDLPAPLYSTRWVRVSDNVFEQYAPLAQRRSA